MKHLLKSVFGAAAVAFTLALALVLVFAVAFAVALDRWFFNLPDFDIGPLHISLFELGSTSIDPLSLFGYEFDTPGSKVILVTSTSFATKSVPTTDDGLRLPVPADHNAPKGSFVLVGARLWDGTGAPARPATIVELMAAHRLDLGVPLPEAEPVRPGIFNITLEPDVAGGRVIVAHLGSGASLCALRDGRSVDTTMAFSVLDGLPMGTRCGCLDR